MSRASSSRDRSRQGYLLPAAYFYNSTDDGVKTVAADYTIIGGDIEGHGAGQARHGMMA